MQTNELYISSQQILPDVLNKFVGFETLGIYGKMG